MSSSSPLTNPSIDPPSNVMRASSADSSRSTGMETFLLTPKMSAKTRRMKRTLCSRASLRTSRLAEGRRDSGRVVEFIDCYRQTKCELIVRTFQRPRADLGDLPKPVEDGMAMHVQRRRRRLHVLSQLEVDLEGSFQFRLVFIVVTPQRRQRFRCEAAQPLHVGALVEERIGTELVVRRDPAASVNAPADGERG